MNNELCIVYEFGYLFTPVEGATVSDRHREIVVTDQLLSLE